MLFFRLEARKSETDSLRRTIRRGLDEVSAQQNLFALYQSAGELLAQRGESAEAIDLLREGMDRIPAENSLSSLYQIAAELLAQRGETAEAIDLLRGGIERIPAEKSLVPLYQTGGMILSRSGRYRDAIELLEDGLERIPLDKHNRERVAEPALYQCLANADQARLDALIAASGNRSLDEAQRILANLFKLELQGRWRETAELAASARLRFPRYLHLTLHESFGWLCAGAPEGALAALDGFRAGCASSLAPQTLGSRPSRP